MTFEHEMNGLLGLSWTEIINKYGRALPLIAKRNKLNSIAELKQKIISWYNGYRFDLSEAGDDVDTLFNPFSIHTLIRNGNFEPYWAETGHSDWILTQGICNSLLRSRAEQFKFLITELKSKRINYSELGAQSDSISVYVSANGRLDKLRLLVALHAGYLSIESVHISDRSPSLHIPNEEVFSTALAYNTVHYESRKKTFKPKKIILNKIDMDGKRAINWIEW